LRKKCFVFFFFFFGGEFFCFGENKFNWGYSWGKGRGRGEIMIRYGIVIVIMGIMAIKKDNHHGVFYFQFFMDLKLQKTKAKTEK
jgi:hypothetical protein